MIRPYALPLEFEARYVAGRVLPFLPVLTLLLAFFWSIESRMLLLFALKYTLFLAFLAWFARRKVRVERARIERLANEDAPFFPAALVRRIESEIVPLVGAVLLVGGLMWWLRQDVRWLMLSAALGALMAAGLMLRWIVYERWLMNLLKFEFPYSMQG